VDLTLFTNLQGVVGQFVSIDTRQNVNESLSPTGAEVIRKRIDQFAARLGTTPRALKASKRRDLLLELRDSGCLEIRRAVEIISAYLGVSRATIYSDVK
jgi:predicted transcriptional regulator YheO